MPIYEYGCRQCAGLTNHFTRKHEIPDSVTCDNCGSGDTWKLLPLSNRRFPTKHEYSEDFVEKSMPFLKSRKELKGMFEKETGESETRYVVLTFLFEPEDDGWFGKCVELGTATWAESLAQLEEELRDLVGLHLVTLEETGRLGQVFDKWRVKLHADMPTETSKSLPVSPWNNGRELRLFQPQMFLLPTVFGATPIVASLHG